jgi:mannan endo-1,4-beta-mannosidase
MFSKMMKAVPAIIAAAGMAVFVMAAPVRYEAQSAATTGEVALCSALPGYPAAGWDAACKVPSSGASNGFYVEMREGELTFTVTVPSAGFYVIWANYSQTCDNEKKQNIFINGISQGAIDFPPTGGGYDASTNTCGPSVFKREKILLSVNLNNGANTIRITKNYGWLDLDYIEVEPFEAAPFNLTPNLVNPNANESARKVFAFMQEKFQQNIISGVMTGDILTGNNPVTLNNQAEVSFIRQSSGKTPAMVGFDFFHGTGKESNTNIWHQNYNANTIALAKELWGRGGIPAFCWHWKDPLKNEEAFYSPGGSGASTTFNLLNACASNNCAAGWNTGSPEYQAMVADIDIVAGYLKELQTAGVAVLWRPVHEASGTWFWWGNRGPAAYKLLYKLIFDRLTTHHNLNNLIWVWDSHRDQNDMDWYPGDNYVDIIGMDFYYYPEQKNHASLISQFESLKNDFGTSKMLALAENGSIPYPQNLIDDGAGWSYFMPWYGQWTNSPLPSPLHNVASDWSLIMNHDYVITLEDMATEVGPSWANYTIKTNSVFQGGAKPISGAAVRAPAAIVRGKTLRVTSPDNSDLRIKMINVQGRTIRTFRAKGSADFPLKNIPAGRYFVEIKKSGKMVNTSAVTVK